jgi:hypothetical protein
MPSTGKDNKAASGSRFNPITAEEAQVILGKGTESASIRDALSRPSLNPCGFPGSSGGPTRPANPPRAAQSAVTRSSTSRAFAVAANAAVLSKMDQTSADFAALVSFPARVSR